MCHARANKMTTCITLNNIYIYIYIIIFFNKKRKEKKRSDCVEKSNEMWVKNVWPVTCHNPGI